MDEALTILLSLLFSLSFWTVIILLIVRLVSLEHRVNNKNLPDQQRYEALGRITNQKKLTKLAMNQGHLDLSNVVTEKINNPEYLASLARGANNQWVRIAAFEKIFNQLVNDKELCFEIAKILPKNPSRYRGNKTELLIWIASVHPDIIRQFWNGIKSANHDDNSRGNHADKGSKFVHKDKSNGWGGHSDNRASRYSDCAHYDHSDTYSHKDQADVHGFLQRFPPAARP